HKKNMPRRANETKNQTSTRRSSDRLRAAAKRDLEFATTTEERRQPDRGKMGIKPLPELPETFGVQGKEGFIRQSLPLCVKIYGRTYHKISGAPAKWSIYDPLEREPQSVFSEEVLQTIEQVRDINSFVTQFEMLVQQQNKVFSLVLSCNVESREISAVIETNESLINNHRTVVVWKQVESNPTFINSDNPLYHSLKYPLFFPHGTPQ
ncbi:hypothetical protein BB559_007302, partial [Furculomyces boomerangus]